MVDESIFVIDEGKLDRFQIWKKERITAVREMLRKLEKTDLKTFVAKVAVKNGFDTRTVRKYLSELEAAGEIRISEGIIISL